METAQKKGKPKQGEPEGVRPRHLQTIQAAAEELLAAKDAHKRTKEDVDQAAELVASALKAAGETAYGWTENGRQILVTLRDKETVSVMEKKPKRKRGEG